MEIEHIDNCFFLLTTKQAKHLSIDGTLPKHGWEKRAKADLSGVTLLHRGRACDLQPNVAKAAWIKRTRFNGENVWAIQFHFSN